MQELLLTGDNSQPIVGAYYPEWAIYDRDYQVTDIPADKLSLELNKLIKK